MLKDLPPEKAHPILRIMDIAISLVEAGLIGALVGVLFTQGRITSGQLSRIATLTSKYLEGGRGEEWESRFREMEDTVGRLPTRWEEVRNEAQRIAKDGERAYGRARHVARSVRKELAERGETDERVEILGSELFGDDDEGSWPETMLPVPESMENGSQAHPHWREVARQRLQERGF